MKPNDFYLGVSEFFSIVVPGFLVTIVGTFLSGQYTLDKTITPLSWIILAIASYVIGHILFAIGATWDNLYEKHKPKGNDELLDKVEALRSARCGDKDCEKINKYQWSRSVLLNYHPDAFMNVARKQADSKLFRSLIIPLLFFSIYQFLSLNIYFGFLSIFLSLVAYWRYRAQRFKACKIAYTHVLTLHSLGKI